MKIEIPELSLVVLIGPSGSGKSTFASKHFLSTEIISSDFCRGLVSDDENNQSATADAFETVHYLTRKRLARGNLTVIDATNVQREARQPLVQIAREYHCLPVAIVLNLPASVCHGRNQERPDRSFGPHVVRQQQNQLRRSLRGLKREGFRHIFVLDSEEAIGEASVERVPLWNNRRSLPGPFDMIGDVHGCYSELVTLLGKLGYERAQMPEAEEIWGDDRFTHPDGRKAVFLGDLVDRGPRILDTLRLVRNMVATGDALCVPGNHDSKLLKKLRGKNVQLTHGLANTVAEIDELSDEVREPFKDALREFLFSLVSHYVLDGGRLVVAHAGMRESMQGRGSGKVRQFALYGETTGETDEFGLPVRFDWAAEYRGCARVVYGHTPVPSPDWLNRTVNIDTGCVFGGRLSALRYPELEFESVPAEQTYCEPAKPFLDEGQHAGPLSSQQQHDRLLDAEDVLGKRIVTTRLRPNITVREENATAALEVMSRFAADPRWLVYLPPTMSPCETSKEPGYLEHPAQAFAFFRSVGVPEVVCEEKHMGSRAVVVVCKDDQCAEARFGVEDGGAGVVYTRTGRRFFEDRHLEEQLLSRVRSAMAEAGFWDEHETDWACFDCELMPWSAKAQELLRSQYAATGAAARVAVSKAVKTLEAATERLKTGKDGEGNGAHEHASEILEKFTDREAMIERYISSYQNYCWSVSGVEDLKLAPFHLLATERGVHANQDHRWHMERIGRICDSDDQLLLKTPYRVINVTDEKSVEEGTAWWMELTADGGEGMVVKPMSFVEHGKKGLVQPALKVRGREYLRIIYGPEYTTEEHLARLRGRHLRTKRSLALREFALGIEALERFVRREPLRRVHECVFGVLALESEPVDPRL